MLETRSFSTDQNTSLSSHSPLLFTSHLGKLPTREALSFFSHFLNESFVDALVDVDFPSRPGGARDILLKELLQHPLPLLQTGKRELELLVNAIQYCL